MTTKILILIGLVGISMCQFIPDNLMLKQAAAVTFTNMDNNPKDGHITLAEMYAVLANEDTNKDGCVTETEFTRVNHIPLPSIGAKLYAHYDHDDDGCLTNSDEQRELSLMDSSGDGVLTLEEFQPFVTNLLVKLVGEVFPIGGIEGK